MNEKLEIRVSEENAGERLDRFLAMQEKIHSRSRATHLIERKMILVNGKEKKASYPVMANDIITVEIPEEKATTLQPMKMDLEVLFEDSDVLVINKPAGLVVHPAAGHEQDTLVNALIAHSSDFLMKFANQRPGIVHRLDKDTSGIMVVAKNDIAHENLSK
ncbi:MAG: pseudouridine synthase, partial [Pseudobdellovibrionaceae bacterium]